MVEQKIKILFYHLKATGCGMYRQLLPYAALKVFDKIELRFIDFIQKRDASGRVDLLQVTELDQNTIDNIEWCDILVFGREWLPQGLAILNFAKRKKKKVVYDLDDNLLIIPNWNPAGRIYNHQQVKAFIIEFLQRVDFITVTHEELAAYFRKYKPTRILKNFVYEPFFKSDREIITKGPNDICIGWAGSSSHYKDLMEVKDTIERLLSEFKNLYFILFGWCPKEIGMIDPQRIKVIKHVSDVLLYYKVLAGLNLDITIAPLVDVNFNCYKSNIKILEFTACKYPVIASKVFEYKKYIEHNKDGMLAGKYIEWYKGLKRLIENPELRKTLVNEALIKFRKYNDITQNCQTWLDTYNDFLGRPRVKIVNDFKEEDFTEQFRNTIFEWAWFGPIAEERNKKLLMRQQIESGSFSGKKIFNKLGF